MRPMHLLRQSGSCESILTGMFAEVNEPCQQLHHSESSCLQRRPVWLRTEHCDLLFLQRHGLISMHSTRQKTLLLSVGRGAQCGPALAPGPPRSAGTLLLLIGGWFSRDPSFHRRAWSGQLGRPRLSTATEPGNCFPACLQERSADAMHEDSPHAIR